MTIACVLNMTNTLRNDGILLHRVQYFCSGDYNMPLLPYFKHCLDSFGKWISWNRCIMQVEKQLLHGTAMEEVDCTANCIVWISGAHGCLMQLFIHICTTITYFAQHQLMKQHIKLPRMNKIVSNVFCCCCCCLFVCHFATNSFHFSAILGQFFTILNVDKIGGAIYLSNIDY